MRNKFFAPCREWLKVHNAFVAKTSSCGYCCGHWIAVTLVAIYRPRLFDGYWVLDYLLTAITVAGLVSFQWLALCLLIAKANK